MKFKGMKQAGFSLVELMVVVGIIGILAALAVPRLQTFTAKAKISEGKALVNNVHTLQESYYAENSAYIASAIGGAGLGVIGFSRPFAANQFYRNPGANVAGNTFTTWTQNALPLCNGILADDPRVAVSMTQTGRLTYGTNGPGAGADGANNSPTFTCN